MGKQFFLTQYSTIPTLQHFIIPRDAGSSMGPDSLLSTGKNGNGLLICWVKREDRFFQDQRYAGFNGFADELARR